MHKDVTTVLDETLTIARPAWEAMLLRDMEALRPELRILLNESLLRRPLLGHLHDDEQCELGLLRLMAVSIPRPQWELLFNALQRRRRIDTSPRISEILGWFWEAVQPDQKGFNLKYWRVLISF